MMGRDKNVAKAIYTVQYIMCGYEAGTQWEGRDFKEEETSKKA